MRKNRVSRKAFLAYVRRMNVGAPKHESDDKLRLAKEYANEAEHQDGAAYWDKFTDVASTYDDFVLYCDNA